MGRSQGETGRPASLTNGKTRSYDGVVASMRHAEARLAHKGHRLTGPRRAVLVAIADAPRPFSIEDICSALPGVGRATVFRTVRLFQDLDVVCRVPLEDGTARYQLSGTQEHHHHLVCTACGAVTEFDDPDLDARISANAADSHFRLDAHSVELYGLCKSCRESNGPAQ